MSGKVHILNGDMVLENPAQSEVEVQLADKDPEAPEKVTMAKNINVLHGTCIIVSTIIGSGIFVSPNAISKRVGSPGMSILIWLGGGILSIMGGITFCELGTMMPCNGAEITYLRKAYGALVSFLCCWLLQIVLGGLRRAIQFLTFSKYFWAVFYDPDGSETAPEWANRLLCIGVLLLLIALITLYPNFTLKIIDVVTVFKLLSISVIIIIGMVELFKGNTQNIAVGFEGTITETQKWGEAWNSVLWSYNGWNVVCVLLGEVKNPEALPKIIALSLAIVTSFYLMTIISYHTVLDMETMSSDKPIASLVGEKVFGEAGVIFFAIAVAVSTLGNSICALLATSRYLQAGGAQGVLPGVFGIVNKRFKTPAFSIIFVFLCSALFILVGDIASLINSASFTSFAFTTLCAAGVIIMRYTLPDHPRPIKINLVFPIFTVLTGIYLFIIPWFTNWEMCLVWVSACLAGIPVYIFTMTKYKIPALLRFSDTMTAFFSKILFSE